MSLETPEERQHRLQLDRDGRQQTRQLCTQSQKIEKYHADLVNLSSSSACSTCHELYFDFPTSHATKRVCSNAHAYKLVKARPHNVSTFF